VADCGKILAIANVHTHQKYWQRALIYTFRYIRLCQHRGGGLKTYKKKRILALPQLERMKDNIIIAGYITSQCEMRGINLCGNFGDWTKVAFSLADLGEDGRPLFHRLASMDERYRQRENDLKFTNALRTASRVGFATLIYMAKQNGINLADIKETAHDCSKGGLLTYGATKRGANRTQCACVGLPLLLFRFAGCVDGVRCLLHPLHTTRRGRIPADRCTRQVADWQDYSLRSGRTQD